MTLYYAIDSVPFVLGEFVSPPIKSMKDHDYIYTIMVLCLGTASYTVHVYIPLP